MCGRYVLALRYGQVQAVLEENGLPADDFYAEIERADDGAAGEELGAQEGDAVFQPSYNFAPGYRGIVCRPVRSGGKDKTAQGQKTGGQGAGNRPEDQKETDVGETAGETAGVTEQPPAKLQLQVMKWGLIPSWMRRRPDYATTLKTINCRADSLAAGKGMWASMRGRKRCVVVAQGFYEWLKTGPKERVPHYIRRRDGLPLLLAGLWDCVTFDGNGSDGEAKEKVYTYTIITTDSNATLRFLHDRMPVIFDYSSPELRMWLDPERDKWSSELQSLLRPWPKQEDDEGASLVVDVVSKEVNKAGHSSPSLIVPVASESNKSNIANFFKANDEGAKRKSQPQASSVPEPISTVTTPRKRPAPTSACVADSSERERGEMQTGSLSWPADESGQPPKKIRMSPTSKVPATSAKATSELDHGSGPKLTEAEFVSATKNKPTGKPAKGIRNSTKAGSSQKITSFFGLKNG